MNENLEERKTWYFNRVTQEMIERGYSEEEAEYIIGKTGFTKALNEYPEEQMHDSISDAVDEIIFVAAAV